LSPGTLQSPLGGSKEKDYCFNSQRPNSHRAKRSIGRKEWVLLLLKGYNLQETGATVLFSYQLRKEIRVAIAGRGHKKKRRSGSRMAKELLGQHFGEPCKKPK